MIVSLETPGVTVGPTAMLRTGRFRRRSSPTARVKVMRRSSSSTVTAARAVDHARDRLRLDRLAERRARRDHREHVRLLLDQELDQRRARRGPARRAARRPPGPPRSTRHPGMPYASARRDVVGTPDRRRRVAAAVEELLPLPHHPQVAVVEDRHLHRDALLHHGGDLLHVHLEAAVARDGPDRLVRAGPAPRPWRPARRSPWCRARRR